MEKLNDIYDDLTRHGTNPRINSAQGEIMAKQRFESGSHVSTSEPPARSSRSRTSKAIALGVVVCGGLLLLYGVLSYARYRA